MPKTIVAEGKTTNEAIANGLKELHVSKDKVEIKVLEAAEKRSFFSILAPRVVKVELTLKENIEKHSENPINKTDNKTKKNMEMETHTQKEIKPEDIKAAKANVEKFLTDFANNFEDISYTVQYEDGFLNIDIQGKSSTKLIGYRGDVLNSIQTILNSIANRHLESKVRVTLNIGNYKEKREKALEELADKVSKTVLRTGKSVTLEPMVAYERKIIHNRLQRNHRIKTYSIGDEPYRKIVISENK